MDCSVLTPAFKPEVAHPFKVSSLPVPVIIILKDLGGFRKPNSSSALKCSSPVSVQGQSCEPRAASTATNPSPLSHCTQKSPWNQSWTRKWEQWPGRSALFISLCMEAKRNKPWGCYYSLWVSALPAKSCQRVQGLGGEPELTPSKAWSLEIALQSFRGRDVIQDCLCTGILPAVCILFFYLKEINKKVFSKFRTIYNHVIKSIIID